MSGTGGRARRWSVATGAVAVAVLALAGCSGERPPAEPAPSSIPPAEQRLQFAWDEAVEVPETARPAVDMAREWTHAYYLWNTEPSTIPRYLTERTGTTLLGEIESAAGSGPPWMTGPVRIGLVEVEIEAGTGAVTLGLCEDTRGLRRIDEQGQPIPESGRVIGHSRLRLVGSDAGGWTADSLSYAGDLAERCREAGSGPPSPSAGPPDG